jgi:Na+/H+-translocating membrane pyrophosphatase
VSSFANSLRRPKTGDLTRLDASLSAFCFLVGGLTSIVSGYIGMMIAVQANSRTALSAQKGYGTCVCVTLR